MSETLIISLTAVSTATVIGLAWIVSVSRAAYRRGYRNGWNWGDAAGYRKGYQHGRLEAEREAAEHTDEDLERLMRVTRLANEDEREGRQ